MHEEIHFPGQHENEQVILFLRRHWIIFLMRMLTIIIAIIYTMGRTFQCENPPFFIFQTMVTGRINYFSGFCVLIRHNFSL